MEAHVPQPQNQSRLREMGFHLSVLQHDRNRNLSESPRTAVIKVQPGDVNIEAVTVTRVKELGGAEVDSQEI